MKSLALEPAASAHDRPWWKRVIPSGGRGRTGRLPKPLSRLLRFNLFAIIPLSVLLFTVTSSHTAENLWRLVLLVVLLSNVNYVALASFYHWIWRPLAWRTYPRYALLGIGALPLLAIATAGIVRGALALFLSSVPIYPFRYLAVVNTVFVILYGMAIFIMEDNRLTIAKAGSRLARHVEKSDGLEVELDRLRLVATQMFLKSHFIFNTLSAIATLIHENPATAEQMTLGLARVLRSILELRERNLIPLRSELDIIREYVSIEQIRLGKRLLFEIELGDDVDAIPVPSMILQPLVENAIQHGVRQRRDGGVVRLVARRDGEHLHVEIADNGPGVSSYTGSGQAMKLLRERLEQSYGNDFELTLSRYPEQGETVIQMIVPVEPERPA
jgi:sensor histidine kinase YesM